MTAMSRAACYVALALLGAVVLACQSSERYIVTTHEIDALGVRGLNLCFAVEPANPHGVWWWHQGRSGCENRSSSVMLGYQGQVTRQPSGAVEATFVVPMKVGEPLPVRLVFGEGTVRAAGTGVTVSTTHRRKLDMPEKL